MGGGYGVSLVCGDFVDSLGTSTKMQLLPQHLPVLGAV